MDVQAIVDGGQELGLQLNISKCELISLGDITPSDPTLSSFLQLTPSNSTLLGAPLMSGGAMESSLFSRVSDLKRGGCASEIISLT